MTERTTGPPAGDELADESEAEQEMTFPAVSVPSTTGPLSPESASEPQVVEIEAGGAAPGEPIPGTTAPQPPDVTSDLDAGGNASLEVATGAVLGTAAPQPFPDPSMDPEPAAELETEATE